MKKAILSLLIAWLCTLSFAKAQVVINGVNINNLDIQYIKLIGYDEMKSYSKTSSKAVLWLDFGQGADYHESSEFRRPVNNQEVVPFRSVIDALNYLYKNGWELIQQYQLDPTSFHYYILQRRNQMNR